MCYNKNMKNLEKVYKIIEELENNHLNLYHAITKKELFDYISKIKNINNLNNIEFDREMLKLFALFKDGHTRYFIPFTYLDKKIFFIENKLLIKDNNSLKEILKIGNLSTSEFIENISNMINYETKEFLIDRIRTSVINGYFYQMLVGAGEQGVEFEVMCDDGKIENIYANLISFEEAREKGIVKKTKSYSYEILDDVLYVRYYKCHNMTDYPFANFVEDVKKVIEEKGINKYILDLRDNHGGDSEVLNPFQQLVRDKDLKGTLLIDNGVFSSGRFAVARFKENFGVTLIGEGTGGAAKSYGYNKNLKVEDKEFSCSIRLWDFSHIFGYEGSIQPDIYVPLTIEDFKNHVDRPLMTALDYLKNEKENNDETIL